jgi:hypothetical protein
MKLFILLLISFILSLYNISPSYVFVWENVNTHPAITQKAVEDSVLSVGDYLQSPRKTTTVEN